MSQTWENSKNLILDTILARLIHIWSHKIFSLSFTSTSSQTLFHAIILCNLKEHQGTKLEKIAKNLILGSMLAQIWAPKFLFVSFTSSRF